MKRNYFALVAILGFGLLSACKQTGNEPNPGGGVSPDDPRNIREVANLLRSAGKLPPTTHSSIQQDLGTATRLYQRNPMTI